MSDEIVGKPNEPKPNYSRDQIRERLELAEELRRMRIWKQEIKSESENERMGSESH